MHKTLEDSIVKKSDGHPNNFKTSRENLVKMI